MAQFLDVGQICGMCKMRISLMAGFLALLVGYANHHRKIVTTQLPASESPTLPSAPPVETFTSSHTLMDRDVNVSLRAPRDEELCIRLISIAVDGTTTIRLDSGEELAAKPAEFYSCSQFGTSGLQLISASRDIGTAVFRRTICESQ